MELIYKYFKNAFPLILDPIEASFLYSEWSVT